VGGALVAAATAFLAATPVEAQRTPPPRAASYVWLGPSGEPLPFQTDEEILGYLRSAEVVDREPIGRGVTGGERLVMERGGVRARAAFKSVDETRRGPFEGLPTSYRRIRDAAVFECAAYELSEALGLRRVPPTVCRRIGDARGMVQIWLEDVMPQDAFLEQAEPHEVARWSLQKHRQHVFDALIANIDRNQGNSLVDREGTLWFIDHTRAFVTSRELPEPEKVTRCSRELWLALRSLDQASLTPRLEPYLRKGEIRALFRRRTELVKHIEELIATHGEEAVLFEIGPSPTPAGAP
jgi:hypothetical protein